MQKFFAVIALLALLNNTSAQNLLHFPVAEAKYYLSNNPGDAEKTYKKDRAAKSQFFQFPVNENSAYNKLIEREMSANRFLGNAPQNDAAVGLDYDVKYYRISLRINPDSVISITPANTGKYVRGSVTTYFTTLSNGFGSIRFDFANILACDSVYYHGAKLPGANKVEQADTLTVTLPLSLANSTLDSITVYYSGVPPVITDFGGATGFVKRTHSSAPVRNYIYTLSEPYGSSTWWPCKSRVASDKADSVDIVVSTPDSFKVAANGIVASETTDGINRITFWKHRYPISSYQVAIGVANYVQYPTTPTMVNINGTMMPFYNFLFPATNTANARTALNRTPLMLTTFSTKFGDYPFKKEKYGHYTFGFGGGMEHNTFSGMGPTTYDEAVDWSVIAHELGHQWWGAAVTCGSWKDIWVNESFARYSEIVCLEFAPSVSATTALTHRGVIKNSAILTTNQAKSTYQNDTTSITTIFSPSVYIYDRGAMIISMLRTVMGDAKFFQAIQNYQADPLLKYKNAFTADVRRHMEAASGLDFSQFFADWIYNTGFASYNAAKWNNGGNELVLYLPQTTQFSGISKFEMPIVVNVKGSNPATMDTTIILYDKAGILHTVNNGVLTNRGGSMIQFRLSFVPTVVTFDPQSLLLANGSVAKDAGLALLATKLLRFSVKKAGQDAKVVWNIDNAYDYHHFELERSSDAVKFTSFASIKLEDNIGKYNFSYTDYNIPYGNWYYRIRIKQTDGTFTYSKTIALDNANSSHTIIITPNPSSDFINILWSENAAMNLTMRLFNVNGRLVKKVYRQAIATNSNWKIPISELLAGNYFLELEANNRQRSIQKIVVIK